MSELTPGTPVRSLSGTGRGVVVVELGNGRVDVLWEHPCLAYNVDTSVLEVDPDGPVFDWVRTPAPEGCEWRLVPENLHEWMTTRGSAICGDTLSGRADLKGYAELNPVPPVVIKPGDWVTSTTHGHGLVLAGDRLHSYQVMHENIDELYVEHYAAGELSADGVRQPWADSVLASLGEGVSE